MNDIPEGVIAYFAISALVSLFMHWRLRRFFTACSACFFSGRPHLAWRVFSVAKRYHSPRLPSPCFLQHSPFSSRPRQDCPFGCCVANHRSLHARRRRAESPEWIESRGASLQRILQVVLNLIVAGRNNGGFGERLCLLYRSPRFTGAPSPLAHTPSFHSSHR